MFRALSLTTSLLLAAATITLAVPGEQPAADIAAISAFKVPDGYAIDLFAGGDMVANPVTFALDAKGNVYVGETFRQSFGVEDNRAHMYWLLDDLMAKRIEDRLVKYAKWDGQVRTLADFEKFEERITRLSDSDGDGVADKRTIFADGFNAPLDGTGAGLLSYRGGIYYTCIPSVYRLEDNDGDGTAEVRTELSRGYGVRDALRGHDLHGLAVGPDGKVYFSLGDRGYHVTTDDGRELFDPMDIGRGAVFRCNADGSELEIYAFGLRNPQELSFDNHGNLFTVDNNSDSGDRARVVYITEGSDAGWSMAFQTLEGDYQRGVFNAEKLWHTQHAGQPAWIVPPVAYLTDGPSGLVHYPGTGLEARYDGHFFVADFRGGPATSGVRSFAAKPSGAGFEMEDAHWFVEGMLVTDVDFGPDGRMYLSDWINGWVGEGSGRIYTLAPTDAAVNPLGGEVARLLGDGLGDIPIQQLAELLSHPDQRVRREAQFELVDRDKPVALTRLANAGKDRLSRLHAIWGLGQLGATDPLVKLLGDSDDEIRAQAAKVLGDRREAGAAAALRAALSDPSARVRYFASVALGRIGDEAAIDGLFGLLKINDNADAYLRHAASLALARIGNRDALLARSGDPSAAVRMGAVLALRRLAAPQLARFLHDAEPVVALEAARAIYDLDIREALPSLAGLIASAPVDFGDLDEAQTTLAFDRRIIAANLRVGTPEAAAALAGSIGDASRSEKFRAIAMDALEQFVTPEPRDPVLGYARPLPAREAGPITAALIPHTADLLSADALRARVIPFAQSMNLPMPAELVLAELADTARPVEVRRAALLAAARTSAADTAIDAGLKDDQPVLRIAAMQLLGERDADAATSVAAERLAHGTPAEQQAALSLLGTLGTEQAGSIVAKATAQLADGSAAPYLELEILEAAEATAAATDALARYRNSLDSADLLSSYRVALVGGDAAKGETLFYSHPAAQCMRCHRYDDRGGNAGPDLTALGTRSDRAYILESLVNPGAKIAAGYGTVSVGLKDGSVHVGLLSSETDTSVTMQLLDGSTQTFEKSKLTFQSDPVSAMPPMLGLLNRREMRDLVEFLAGGN